MKNCGRTVVFIVMLALLSGILNGCILKKEIVDNHILDGDGMINTNALLMDALAGDWASADGRWSAAIEGYELELMLDGESLYDGSMYFSFHEDDTNVKTELFIYAFENKLIKSAMEVVGTIKKFYTENGMLYMEVTYANGDAETVVFEKSAQ